MQTQQIKDALSLSAANETERANKIAQEALNYAEQHALRVALLKCKIEPLQAALQTEGLEIDSLTACASGNNSGLEWRSDTKLRVSVVAAPISGKFRFLTFKGCTAGGRDRQQDQLQEKANKLARKLGEATGCNTQVNWCSLQVKDDRQRKRVLIEMWV